ncbi:MAG: type II secretion system F family protein [Candidatus Caldarchaeum sp.]|jgi:Flp pilus assembly protein TadB|uniref:Type II secretion system protein GspF domain-containing protein n=1 Tax=Caldiarchaeum subterraneum TaxID=311458 RepID=A0A7J3G7D2_CALS0
MQDGTVMSIIPALSAGIIGPLAVFSGNIPMMVGAVTAPVAAFAGSSLGKKFSARFEGYAVKVARASMKRVSSYELAEKISSAIGASIASVLVIAAVALISLFTHSFNPLVLAGFGPAAAPIFMTMLSASNSASNRKTALSTEYPFFMVFSSIVAYCGGTIYMALQHVKKATDVFKQVSKEAGEIERKAVFAGVGAVKSVEAHAETIPHEEFSRALLTTTSVWRTGGDMVSTLEDLAEEALKYMTEKFERFTSSIAAYIEILFTALVLLPLGMSLTVIVGGESTQGMVLLNTFITPFLGLVLLLAVRNAMPKIPNRISLDTATLVKALSVAAASAAIAYVVQAAGIPLPYPVIIAAGVGVTALLVYASMRHQVGEIEEAERELKRFVRIAVEERKAGKTMYHSLKTAAAQRYSRHFQAFVKGFSTRLTMGLGIYHAASTARSWLTRVILWLIDMVDRLGGASPQLMEKVITALTYYSAAREAQRGRTKLFLYLTYATPFIASMMFGMVHPLIAGTAFGGTNLELPEAPQGGPSFNPSPELAAQMIDMGFLMMIIAASTMALTISYAIDSHPFGLHRVAITAFLFIPAYYSVPLMSELVRATLFPSQV